MNLLGILCNIIGPILFSSKELYKSYLGLSGELLYKQIVVESEDQEKINKYKWFVNNIYNNYNLIYIGPILLLIGIVILALH